MSYAQGMVPTAAVAPLLRRGLLTDFGDRFYESGGAGNLPRTLKKWENEVEWAEFNSVDRALAKVDMVSAWREEEPDSYFLPDLSANNRRAEQRCERQGCSTVIVPGRGNGRPKRYCSFACYRVEYEARRNRRKRVGGKRHALRGMVCAKGHDLHGANLRERVDNMGHRHRWCHQCKIEKQRAYRASRRLALTKG